MCDFALDFRDKLAEWLGAADIPWKCISTHPFLFWLRPWLIVLAFFLTHIQGSMAVPRDRVGLGASTAGGSSTSAFGTSVSTLNRPNVPISGAGGSAAGTGGSYNLPGYVHRQTLYYSSTNGNPAPSNNAEQVNLDSATLDTYRRKIHELQAELKSKDDHLKINAEHVRVQQAALQTAVQNKEKAQALIKELQGNIAELNVRIEQRDAEIRALNAQLSELTAKDVNGRNEMASLQQDVSSLRAQLKLKSEELTVAQAQLAEAKVALSAQNSQLVELKSKCDILQRDNETLAQKILGNRELREELERLKAENAKLTAQMRDLAQEAELKSAHNSSTVRQLQSRVQMYENQLVDQTSLMAKVRELEAGAAKAAETEARLLERIHKHQTELNALATRIQDTEKRHDAVVLKRDQWKAQNKLLEDQLQDMRNALKEAEVQLAELRTHTPLENKLDALQKLLETIPENVLQHARKYRAAATLSAIRKAQTGKGVGEANSALDLLAAESDPEARLAQLELIHSLEMDLGVYPVEHDSPVWLRMELRKVFFEEFEAFTNEVRSCLGVTQRETASVKAAVETIPESIERLVYSTQLIDSVKSAVSTVNETVERKVGELQVGLKHNIVEPIAQEIAAAKAVTHTTSAQTLEQLAELRKAVDRSESNALILKAVEDAKVAAINATASACSEVVAANERAAKVAEGKRDIIDAKIDESLRNIRNAIEATRDQAALAARNADVANQGIERMEPALSQLKTATNHLADQITEFDRKEASRHDEVVRTLSDVNNRAAHSVIQALDALANTVSQRATEARTSLEAFEQRAVAAREAASQARANAIAAAQKQLQDELAAWRAERAEEHKRMLEREKATEAARAQLLQTVQSAILSAMDETSENVLAEIRAVGESTKHLPASMAESLRIVSMLSEEIAKLSASEVEFLVNNASKLVADMRELYLKTEETHRKQLSQLATDTSNSFSAVTSALNTLSQDVAESFRGLNRSVQGVSAENRSNSDSAAARIQATFSNTVAELRQNIRALSQSLDDVINSLAGALPQTLAQSLRAALAEEHRPVVEGIARLDRAVTSTTQNVASAVTAGVAPVLQGFEHRIEQFVSEWKLILSEQSSGSLKSLGDAVAEAVRTLQKDLQEVASRINSALATQLGNVEGSIQKGDAAQTAAISQLNTRVGMVGDVVANIYGSLERERELAAQSRNSITSSFAAVQAAVTQSATDTQQNITSTTRGMFKTLGEQIERTVQSQGVATKEEVVKVLTEHLQGHEDAFQRDSQAIVDTIKFETGAHGHLGKALTTLHHTIETRTKEAIEETRRQHAQLHNQLHQALDTLGSRIAGIETCKAAVLELREAISRDLAGVAPQVVNSLTRSLDTLFTAIGVRQDELKQGVQQSLEAIRSVSVLINDITSSGRLSPPQYQQLANALSDHGATISQLYTLVQESSRATAETFKLCDKTAMQLTKLAADQSHSFGALPDKRAVRDMMNESQQAQRNLLHEVRSVMETTAASVADARSAIAQLDAVQQEIASLVRSDIADTTKAVSDRASEVATVIQEWSDAIRKRLEDQSMQTSRTLQGIIAQVGDVATRLSDLTTVRQGQVDLRAALRDTENETKAQFAAVKTELLASIVEQQTSVRRIEKHLLETSVRETSSTRDSLRLIADKLVALQRAIESISVGGGVAAGGAVIGQQTDAVLRAMEGLATVDNIETAFARIMDELAPILQMYQQMADVPRNIQHIATAILQNKQDAQNNTAIDRSLETIKSTVETVEEGVKLILHEVEHAKNEQTRAAQVLNEVKAKQEQIHQADKVFKKDLQDSIIDIMKGLQQVSKVALTIRNNLTTVTSPASGSETPESKQATVIDHGGLISQLTLQVADLNTHMQHVANMVTILSRNRDEVMESLASLSSTPSALRELRELVQNLLNSFESTNALATSQLTKLSEMNVITSEIPSSTRALFEDLKGALIPLAQTLRAATDRLDHLEARLSYTPAAGAQSSPSNLNTGGGGGDMV